MNNLDQDIEAIIQILTENTSYSPQAQAYIIHGAIEKLIQWRNSFLTNNQTMKAMQLAESPAYASLSAVRKRNFIVMHAQRIWKGYFFESAEEAAGVIQSCHPGKRFKTLGGTNIIAMVPDDESSRFTIYPVDQFKNMEDLKLPQS